ncbi:fimbrial chaperone [Escherichia albertii]|nr:fimbrial chaperone [Escherichia albertii]MCZ8849223.1 fimbrial chaperone [Escherichia albertii]
MFPLVKKTISALFISTLLTSAPAFADIIISGTRIIYNSDKKDVNVRLENKGNRPLLIQNWLDTGDDNADPSQIKVPFTATPPVSRVEPKRGQTVKVMFTGATDLPKDRESVYWFNVLEVPPKPKDAKTDKNLLQLAFRTRIKLFYRPSGLQGEPAEAPAKITWKLNNAQLLANNPTPYYVSFNDITLESAGKNYKVDSSMVAPFSQASFSVTGQPGSVSSGKVNYKAINDFGGNIDGSATF